MTEPYGMTGQKKDANKLKIGKYERRKLMDIQGVAWGKIFKWMFGLGLYDSGYGQVTVCIKPIRFILNLKS